MEYINYSFYWHSFYFQYRIIRAFKKLPSSTLCSMFNLININFVFHPFKVTIIKYLSSTEFNIINQSLPQILCLVPILETFPVLYAVMVNLAFHLSKVIKIE